LTVCIVVVVLCVLFLVVLCDCCLLTVCIVVVVLCLLL